MKMISKAEVLRVIEERMAAADKEQEELDAQGDELDDDPFDYEERSEQVRAARQMAEEIRDAVLALTMKEVA